jgi:hypothetical protein
MADLFDRSLEPAGIKEHYRQGQTSEQNRCRTDGENFLWVSSKQEGLVNRFTRWFPNGNPQYILSAIAIEFDVEIVSEHGTGILGF